MSKGHNNKPAIEEKPVSEEVPAVEEKLASEGQPATAEAPVGSSLLQLVRAARIAVVSQIGLTPLSELNRVRAKLLVCEEILSGLPAAAIAGTTS